MRVGIIRGDLPGPLFLADLEPTSQIDFPVDPPGQTRYVGRPDLTTVGTALASAPAAIVGTADIVFPLTITLGVDDVLLLREAGGLTPFTTVTIFAAAYANLAALLSAVNAALVAAGMTNITAVQGSSALRLNLVGATGPGAYIENDTVLNGSTANTGLGLPDGATWTVPTAAAVITATLPVGGPLDVSPATLLGLVSPVLTAAQILAIQDAIAPKFVETDVVKKSFEVGNLAGFISPLFVPDPHRMPAMTPGPAITVVQDDGVTLYTAPLPRITGAASNTPNAGDITITGVGMALTEWDQTIVKVENPVTGQKVHLEQKLIRSTLSGGTQGVVTPTSIVIPASLLAGLGLTAGKRVSLTFTTLSNTVYGTAANITAVAGGLMTLTNLAAMNTYMIGNVLNVSGAATPANNGQFRIAAYVSATSVRVENPYGYAPDANNGAIRWSVPPPVTFVTT